MLQFDRRDTPFDRANQRVQQTAPVAKAHDALNNRAPKTNDGRV